MLAPCQELKAETAHGAVIDGAKYNFGAEPWSIEGKFHKQEVSLASPEKPGTIIISDEQALSLSRAGQDGKALRYGIGVGRKGFHGRASKVSLKAEWPDWHSAQGKCARRDPTVPEIMKGGPDNPLGARAMYLGNTVVPHPWHRPGPGPSAPACPRAAFGLTNDDVTDLYQRVKIGTKVIVE